MFTVKCSNLNNILLPAKDGDVGFDLIATSDPVIVGSRISQDSPYFENIEYIEYEVDLKIEPDIGYYSLIYPRSSISKYNLQLCNSVGVIDNGYRGNLKIRFNYLWQPKDINKCKYLKDDDFTYFYENYVCEIDEDKIYKKGDKIAQLVFAKSIIPNLIKSDLSNSERGDTGFGSTNI